MKEKKWRLRWWHLALISLGPAAYLLLLLADRVSPVADFYATKIYPYLAGGISFVAGLLPFSLGEMTLILALLAGLVGLVWLVVALIKKPQKLRRLLGALVCVACVASTLYAAFVCLAGINYRRTDWATVEQLETVPRESEELADLYALLVQETNEAALQVQRDANGVFVSQTAFSKTASMARSEMRRLGETYPSLAGAQYGKPKPVLASELMSVANITGIFWPFTVEANVNTHAPAYTLPATLCHEQAHQRGFMREDEANFIALLACFGSKDPTFRYSGLMLALTYTENALWGADAELCGQLAAELCDEIRADRRASSEYWKQYETKVAEVSEEINNTYLESNDQTDGVQSYGRVVDLLLAYRAAALADGQHGFLPKN